MGGFFERVDAVAGIEGEGAVRWLERAAFVFLLLTFASAPHSIAATQTAWIVGMLAWVVRLFLRPGVRFRFGALDAALWALFGWSVVSSLVSYEPAVSLDKLRGVAVFLIFYFAYYNLRTRRAAAIAALVLIGSCMVNVVWMPIERLIGRGVEIQGVSAESPLAKGRLLEGDTLLEADGRRLTTPEDVLAAVESREVSRVKFYRPDFEYVVEVKRSDLLPGGDALTRLGIGGWKKSHNWRSKGFYGHYTTYAEVLQLIGSLAFGLFIAAFVAGGRKTGDKRKETRERRQEIEEVGRERAEHGAGFFSPGLSSPVSGLTSLGLLFAAVAGISLALLLTVTRAPQLGFLISAGLIVLLGLGWKRFAVAAVILVPVAAGGLLFLQRSRGVEFIDKKDESSLYRQMMWRDGLRLWSENPRHFIFGVGMDSIKQHWQEWGLFDGGRQPMGHFHSTPVQLLVERGLPALLIWLAVIVIYALGLLRWLRRRDASDWRFLGIVLGCLGGLVGFVASSIVHYNLGDQEVAMVFFLIMGVGWRIVSETGHFLTE